jgi:hypothetical protein
MKSHIIITCKTTTHKKQKGIINCMLNNKNRFNLQTKKEILRLINISSTIKASVLNYRIYMND